MNVHWFNAGAPRWSIRHPWSSNKLRVQLWNLFKRRSTDGHWWGVGVLQINSRHLMMIGRTSNDTYREVWTAHLLFIPLTSRDRYQCGYKVRRNLPTGQEQKA